MIISITIALPNTEALIKLDSELLYNVGNNYYLYTCVNSVHNSIGYLAAVTQVVDQTVISCELRIQEEIDGKIWNGVQESDPINVITCLQPDQMITLFDRLINAELPRFQEHMSMIRSTADSSIVREWKALSENPLGI